MGQVFLARQMGFFFRALLLSAIGLGFLAPGKVQTAASISSLYMRVTVTPGGAYTIGAKTPAWTFGGNIGQPLTTLSTTTGNDEIGSYQEIDFNYRDNNASSRGSGIRTYNGKPIALFLDTYLSPSSPNNAPFPHLKTYPGHLYHLTYSDIFAHPTFTNFGTDSPWVYFDSHENAFMLSPASNFLITNTTQGTDGSISSGITSVITGLPQGFTQKTFLVIQQGVNKIFETWGHAMTDLQGKTRPANDADATLNSLGYWTDRGATYYYTYDPSLGYQGTLLAIANSFKHEGIPLGYMQLDSWWYPKGASDSWQGNGPYRGGISTYTAAPALFPNGLQAFQHQLGLPLVTHSRWIDTSSPYRKEYAMSNNVSIDPRYWEMIGNYLHTGGAITHEQDWLSSLALPATNLTDRLMARFGAHCLLAPSSRLTLRDRVPFRRSL